MNKITLFNMRLLTHFKESLIKYWFHDDLALAYYVITNLQESAMQDRLTLQLDSIPRLMAIECNK